MFKQRLISAGILMPCTIAMLFLLPLLEFKSIIFLLCILSAWEWGKLLRLTPKIQKLWLLSMLILLYITFQSCTYQLFCDYNKNQIIACIILIWWLIALLLTLFYPYSATLWKKSTGLQLTFGMLIIIPFFWGTLIIRYYDYNQNHYFGSWLLLYIMILVWGMDSFSYIIGYKFGNHQVTPQLSPHKTWEGYIGGGIIMSIIFLIFLKYIPLNIQLAKLLFFSIIIILSSILGDLTESMFKRESKVKDSGRLIPGHGGILDTMDSLYSSIPIFASLLSITLPI